MTPLELVLSKLPGNKRSGKGFKARCPAHDDRNPSLSISEDEHGAAVVKCYANHGCTTNAICQAIGLRVADLFPAGATGSTFNGNRAKPAKRSNAVAAEKKTPRGRTFATSAEAIAELERNLGKRLAEWTYHDSAGKPVCVVARWDRGEEKEYRPVSLDGEKWRIAGIAEPRPLYALPEIAAAETVYVCEGEKAADAVRSLGLTATTSMHGAKSAEQTDWGPLAARAVVILPDNDSDGGRYADTVTTNLGKLQPRPTIKIVNLPGLPEKGDAVEWIEARDASTKDELRAELEQLVARAEPIEVDEPATRVQGTSQPIVVKLADVEPEPVRWLWPQRIASGKLTIVSGDPGLGKSFLSCDLAARVSKGGAWPDDVLIAAPLGGVVMLNCEDDLADTIRPRLDRHGADVRKIVALSGVRDTLNGNRERQFNLARDLPALEQAVREIGDCRLVVIDPLMAYLGGNHDSHKAADVRSLLAPLSDLAARYDIAVLGISHLNKGSGPAMYRTMGSLAFVAAARAVWCVTKDRDDPARRLFLPVKNNLGNDSTGLAYSIVDGALVWEPGPVETTADEALTPTDNDNPRSARAEAEAWVASQLTPGTTIPAKTILCDAREHGISPKRARDAANRLGVVIAKSGMRGGWTWTRPENG